MMSDDTIALISNYTPALLIESGDKMKKLNKLLSCAVFASASLAMSGVATAAAPSLTATAVLTKLENPWDMAFLPDGAMFFTEKCHGLSVRLPSGSVNKLVGMKDAKGYADAMPDLFCDGQAGMNGVAVDPDFAKNRYVYVYSTSSKSNPQTNRVIRLKVNADLSKTSDRTDIVDDIPYKTAASDHPFGSSGAHNGG
jgi:glucose/arabinose dehydrogenase